MHFIERLWLVFCGNAQNSRTEWVSAEEMHRETPFPGDLANPTVPKGNKCEKKAVAACGRLQTLALVTVILEIVAEDGVF